MEGDIIWKLSKLSDFGVFSGRKDNDWCDRLNFQITCLIHIAFIAIISVRSQFGKPIQCWFPQEYSRTWQDYSETYCWISGTYYAPLKEDPQLHDPKSQVINYYQWASTALTIQTLFFLLPYIVWQFLSSYSNFRVAKLLRMSNQCHMPVSYENYLKTIELISNNFHKCVRHNMKCSFKQNGEEMRHKSKMCCSPSFSGMYLFHIYIFIKFLYVINIIAQIHSMTVFLGFKDFFFGIKLLKDIITGNEWMESGNFPRVTFCDISTVKFGGQSIHHIQCLLPINMFLEKIYTFLWFYYLSLGIITIFNILSWIFKIYLFKSRLRIIKKSLKMCDGIKNYDKTLCKTFVHHYLQMDGVFLLHLIAINIGDVIANDIIWKLWHHHCYEFKKMDSPKSLKMKYFQQEPNSDTVV